MKYLKNRFVIATGAIILAMVICFILVPAVYNDRGKLTEIVRVKEPIDTGTVITEKMLETITVGGYNLPEGVAAKAGDVVGKYALAKLEPGDYILVSKVGSEFVGSDNYLQSLDGSQFAMSIAIPNLAAGLSGKLQVNDIISIAEVTDDGGKIPPELQYVKIIGVATDGGKEAGEKEADEKQTPSTITVLVNQKQAEKLAGIEAENLHFVLVFRGDTESAQKYLAKQNEYFGAVTKTDDADKTATTETKKEENTEEKKESADNAENVNIGNVTVTEKEGSEDAQ